MRSRLGLGVSATALPGPLGAMPKPSMIIKVVGVFIKSLIPLDLEKFVPPPGHPLLLVGGVDDLHKVGGLQGGAADQAAVLVVAKSAKLRFRLAAKAAPTPLLLLSQ